MNTSQVELVAIALFQKSIDFILNAAEFAPILLVYLQPPDASKLAIALSSLSQFLSLIPCIFYVLFRTRHRLLYVITIRRGLNPPRIADHQIIRLWWGLVPLLY
jgi:hypothetical protein